MQPGLHRDSITPDGADLLSFQARQGAEVLTFGVCGQHRPLVDATATHRLPFQGGLPREEVAAHPADALGECPLLVHQIREALGADAEGFLLPAGQLGFQRGQRTDRPENPAAGVLALLGLDLSHRVPWGGTPGRRSSSPPRPATPRGIQSRERTAGYRTAPAPRVPGFPGRTASPNRRSPGTARRRTVAA